MEVHHIWPLYMGGDNSFENLIHLTQTEHRVGGNFKTNHPCRGTMSTYSEMSETLLKAPNLLRGTGVDEGQIQDAERVVGSLPSDYRNFLAEFGWAMFYGTSIWGLGDGFPYVKSFVQLTLLERGDYGLPVNLIAFSNNGSGDILCFKSRENARIFDSVYVRLHETGGLHLVADNFSQYMLDRIASAVKSS